MDENDTIEVLVLEPSRPPPGRQAVPRPDDIVKQVVEVPVAVAREAVQKVAAQVAELVRDMPANEGQARLDQVSVELAVSGSGEVRWVAGLGVEVGSTLTLTFKVADIGQDGAS